MMDISDVSGLQFTMREEEPDDRRAVLMVLQQAFGGPAEADLVERLYAENDVLVGLVAAINGQIAGHILFSRLPIDLAHGETLLAAALAPLAVLPGWQRRGIGAALVRQGLAWCRDQGIPAVVVLGDPAYYSRFGFSAAVASGLQSPWSGPHLMAVELVSGVLKAHKGVARYAAAFAAER